MSSKNNSAAQKKNNHIRMLYLMHIDWNWVWQRPQALAAALCEKFDLWILYRLNPFRKRLTKNKQVCRTIPLLPIPEIIFGNISHCLQKVYIGLHILLLRPHVIWVTFPDLLPILPNRLMREITLVYDCMDLAEGFFSDRAARQRIKELEERLLERADIIFCSSKHLLNQLGNKTNSGKIYLVRNGAPQKAISNAYATSETNKTTVEENQKGIHLCYFGTISIWMDWEVLQQITKTNKNIHIHFIGPVEHHPPYEHNRMHFHGPMTHQKLYRAAQKFDAFIMPFKKNDLILGVDPVKMYEYISFSKPVFSIYYPEIDRFNKFVIFYESATQLEQYILKMQSGVRMYASQKERINFIEANSWECRAQTIIKTLKKHIN
ncbi:glycosyltransferase family 1 protein [Desulfovibrio sp. JC022]|uniref:glycosyltransferase family 1 protein n=1 Tax=Desulfovibrio sp. JC022 TaxID=2593642 RepID=UPI0013D192E6|nr:glycosyltransferase family 1 protein [Desulfovibrio sp. JC022]NDV24916.1 glycosyltransferase family 1 protein [Desulfovibrio sp. JC022]